MNRPSDNGLTAQQQAAARHPARLLSVEAGPGTGKTRVAAHRFGLLRFDPRDTREVVALSYTRSAAAELRDRIETLWGSAAVAWPHSVGTLDDFYRRLVGHLLTAGLITLPGGQSRLDVQDTWPADTDWSPTHGTWEITLVGTSITTVLRREGALNGGFTSPGAAHAQLLAARCTHAEIREILSRAFAHSALRGHLVCYLSLYIKAVLIDEVYDGNDTEAEFMAVVAQARLDLTVIGDPRQVLYEFRNARPERIKAATERLGLTHASLAHSHRFSPDVEPVATALRTGQGVVTTPCAPVSVDVVLSSQWERLWKLGDEVMPLRFNKVSTVADAALHLLLDACAVRGTGLHGACVEDAVRALGIPSRQRRANHESEYVGRLLESVAADPTELEAQELLANAAALAAGHNGHRTAVMLASTAPKYATCIKRLAALWAQPPGSLVPAMSIHQAKGREWNRVALCVTEGEHAMLNAGLDDNAVGRRLESQRRLYVGMTRARTRIAIVEARTGRQAPRWYSVTAMAPDAPLNPPLVASVF